MESDDDNTPFFDVPESPIIRVERPSPYGGVPDLDEDELAEPEELARMAFREDWRPILDLPDRLEHGHIRPHIDEDGHRDWGAFDTVDFERLHGRFDRARYRADRLADELRYSRIRFETVAERVPAPARDEVLSYLRRGVVDYGHIVNEDMQAVARWDARIQRQQEELRSLRSFRWERRHSQDE